MCSLRASCNRSQSICYNVYLETGGSWTVQTTSAHGGSGDALWATGSGLTGYGTFSLSENLPTYTVAYNANAATSGSVPSDQTKIQGIDLTLASNSGNLAKTGYTFAGWNTTADGSGTDYAEGTTYSFDADATIYAKWMATGDKGAGFWNLILPAILSSQQGKM